MFETQKIPKTIVVTSKTPELAVDQESLREEFSMVSLGHHYLDHPTQN
jgi:hypothetical protein